MGQQRFSLAKRMKSFKYAFNGLKILLREEHNSRIHFFVAICVVIAGFVLKISSTEWIAIVFAIGLVISLEIINSTIENIADFISPEKHVQIKKIKDLAAASVLVCTMAAAVIGFLVFTPKILAYLGV